MWSLPSFNWFIRIINILRRLAFVIDDNYDYILELLALFLSYMLRNFVQFYVCILIFGEIFRKAVHFSCVAFLLMLASSYVLGLIYVDLYICVCVHVCMHACVCECMYVCIYIIIFRCIVEYTLFYDYPRKFCFLYRHYLILHIK